MALVSLFAKIAPVVCANGTQQTNKRNKQRNNAVEFARKCDNI